MSFPLYNKDEQKSAIISVKMAIQTSDEGFLSTAFNKTVNAVKGKDYTAKKGKLTTSSWFTIPNENIKSFQYNMDGGGSSTTATLTLYDSYDQGRGKGVLDNFLLTLWGTAKGTPLVVVNFGWQNNMSGDTYFGVTQTDYNLSDNGLIAVLTMMPEFSMPFQSLTTFDKEFDSSLEDLDINDYHEIFKQLFTEYNSKQTNPNYKISKNKDGNLEPVYINCPEIKEGRIEQLKDSYKASGKKFFDCMNNLVSQMVMKGEDGKAILYKYEWMVYGDSTTRRIYIWRFDWENKKIRKYYYFRRGVDSNIISFTYSNFDYKVSATGALSNAINVYYTDGDTEDIKELTPEKQAEKDKISAKMSERMRNILKANAFPKLMDGENINRLSVHEDVDKYVNPTTAAKIVMRNAYHKIAENSMPIANVVVLGDPAYKFIPPNQNEKAVTGSGVGKVNLKNNPSRSRMVGLMDNIYLGINNPASGGTFFSGTYIIKGFVHNVNNAGDFTTTIKAQRVFNSPKNKKKGKK